MSDRDFLIGAFVLFCLMMFGVISHQVYKLHDRLDYAVKLLESLCGLDKRLTPEQRVIQREFYDRHVRPGIANLVARSRRRNDEPPMGKEW